MPPKIPPLNRQRSCPCIVFGGPFANPALRRVGLGHLAGGDSPRGSPWNGCGWAAETLNGVVNHALHHRYLAAAIGLVDMIPTKLKQKLPKALSWPVGAEAVTVSLGAAPHADEFTLWFNDSPVWRASEFQKTLREALPYAVLVAEYSPSFPGSKSMDEAGINHARWQLHVNPVPRPWRAAVATLIREKGLPAISEWLNAFKGDGWERQHHRLELGSV